MKTPCETASKYVLPSIRALIAKKLVDKYRFTKLNAALRLGMSPTAMSKYLAEKRGAAIGASDEIDSLAEGVARSISEGKITPEEYVEKLCNICMVYRQSDNVCKRR